MMMQDIIRSVHEILVLVLPEALEVEIFARITIKVRKKAKIRTRYNQVLLLTQDTTWVSGKTKESITHKRAKRSALSQQVTTRLQRTDKTVWQTGNRNNKKDPQKNNRLERSVFFFFFLNYLRA